MDNNTDNNSITSCRITITLHGFEKRVMGYTNVNMNKTLVTPTQLVDDVAAIKFKLTIEKESGEYLVYMLYQKHESKQDALINIKVTCEDPEYCEELTCSMTLTRTLIVKARATRSFENVGIYEIPLSLYVQAYQMPTLSKCEMFYNDEDFTDFCFVTNDGKVPVHRACMAAHSGVFKAMLHGEWKETADGHIKIKGDQVTLETLNNLKDYMYLGELPEDEVELQTLLLIADRFMMHYLRDECIRKLTSLVTADNFLDILEFAICNKFTKLTFSILLLTQEDVIRSAYNLVKNELVGPGQG